MSTVHLREVTRENWRDALALSVTPDQQRFVAAVTPPVAIALAKAFVRPAGLPVLPLAVYSHDAMVGFLNLTCDPEFGERYWLHHFFIDRRYQGRGYGKATMRALLALLRTEHPGSRRIGLTVHPDNLIARRLYEGCGFVATGETSDGEPIYVLRLR